MHIDDVPILTLAGGARDRGHIHGETLRALIQDHVATWLDHLGRVREEAPLPYLRQFLNDTGHLGAMRRLMPSVLSEVEALAAAADIAPDIALTLQMQDEEWAYARRRSLRAADQPRERCTAIAVVTPDGRTLVAQNQDLARWSEGFQTILIHEPDDGIRKITPAGAGEIGISGVNAAGLGLCLNTLADLQSDPDGLPLSFLIRALLDCRSFDDAKQALIRAPRGAAQNFMLGAPGMAASFEASADKVVEHTPLPGASRFWAVNQPYANDDFLPELSDALSLVNRDGFPAATSPDRMAALTRRFGDPHAALAVAEIKEALASRDSELEAICFDGRGPCEGDGPSASWTAFSMIFSLSDEIAAEIAPGPPSSTPYMKFEL